MPDPTGGHDQLTARLAGHTQAFEKLFAEYFDSLGGALDTPSFSRFTPECLDLLRELSLRGGKRIRVVILHEAARLVTDGPVPGLDSRCARRAGPPGRWRRPAGPSARAGV
ncbi:hypothetical protein [Streptomyces sp. NPDC054804]